ncbi:hypothetical protein QCA50_001286 [Cerrena zonata]|uniref:Uncharacterized protein n=1 Tax=Cerrena zonata TaxID=2478898 RepID=A0AAW0GSN2_9APHY
MAQSNSLQDIPNRPWKGPEPTKSPTSFAEAVYVILGRDEDAGICGHTVWLKKIEFSTYGSPSLPLSIMCRSRDEAELYLAMQTTFSAISHLSATKIAEVVKDSPDINYLGNLEKDDPDHWDFYAVLFGNSKRSCIYLSWADLSREIEDNPYRKLKGCATLGEAFHFLLMKPRTGKDSDETPGPDMDRILGINTHGEALNIPFARLQIRKDLPPPNPHTTPARQPSPIKQTRSSDSSSKPSSSAKTSSSKPSSSSQPSSSARASATNFNTSNISQEGKGKRKITFQTDQETGDVVGIIHDKLATRLRNSIGEIIGSMDKSLVEVPSLGPHLNYFVDCFGYDDTFISIILNAFRKAHGAEEPFIDNMARFGVTCLEAEYIHALLNSSVLSTTTMRRRWGY